jgi:hypothetical protein
MRLTLEHNDVIKALALYVRSKGFVVEATPENFVIVNESADPSKFDLVVTVKNADTAPTDGASATRSISRPTQGSQVSRSATRPTPPQQVPKNDLFRPIAPPRPIPPAPKHRVLDKQAASSPALMWAAQHPHMPRASVIVPAFEDSEKKAEDLVDDYAPPSVSRTPDVPSESALIVDPSEMSPDDRAVFEDIIARSQAAVKEGPQYAEDSFKDPVQPEGYVEDE